MQWAEHEQTRSAVLHPLPHETMRGSLHAKAGALSLFFPKQKHWLLAFATCVTVLLILEYVVLTNLDVVLASQVN